MKYWRQSLVLMGLATLTVGGCDLGDLVFAGNPTPTAVSGTSTSNVHTLSVADGKYAVEAIDWAEGGVTGGLDRPCFLQVTFRSLADPVLNSATDDTVTRSVNVCNSNSYTNSSMKSVDLNFAKESIATGNIDGWHLFANSIKVCDSKQSGNDRIKGITVWGVSQNATLFPTSSDYLCHSTLPNGGVSGPCTDAEVRSDSAEHTNCGTWKSLVTCPSGQIASGVDVHVDGNEIVGLGLECDTVVSEPSSN